MSLSLKALILHVHMFKTAQNKTADPGHAQEMLLPQVQEVAKSSKLTAARQDGSMQRTSTAFKNRSGFRGVRRVGHTHAQTDCMSLSTCQHSNSFLHQSPLKYPDQQL